jgi:hypothetical protein
MVVTASFKNWLKGNMTMKLSSDAAVLRLCKEGLTNFDSLTDFDKKSLERLPSVCKETITAIAEDIPNGIVAEPAVPGANISSISIQRLIVAMHAAEYYTAINRSMTSANMHYINVLKNFKIEWETYQDLRDQAEPTVPLVSEKDGDRKIIKWVPIFIDCLTRTYGVHGPLVYVLRDDPAVPLEATDPLDQQSYFGSSGSLHDELVARLSHTGPIFKNDNTSVFMKVEKATRGTSVESTVKAFSRRKDGRGAFLALISNHAGDTKYRAILKKRMSLLQNIKWNGRAYPLETHVSNHRQAVDELRECAEHITATVPNKDQRVEYLIDSITCSDNTLQAAIGLIRANTNNMRNDFELAATALIEVDPYRRSQRSSGSGGRQGANVSATGGIDFSAGRGTTGVDLRWHPRKEFKSLPEDQRNELSDWFQTNEGKKFSEESRNQREKVKNKNGDKNKNKRGGRTSDGNWKKKFKKALKTDSGLKSVMSLLADAEKSNSAFVSALQSSFPVAHSTANISSVNTATTVQAQLPPVAPTPAIAPSVSCTVAAALPATSVKLNSILKNGK